MSLPVTVAEELAQAQNARMSIRQPPPEDSFPRARDRDPATVAAGEQIN